MGWHVAELRLIERHIRCLSHDDIPAIGGLERLTIGRGLIVALKRASILNLKGVVANPFEVRQCQVIVVLD